MKLLVSALALGLGITAGTTAEAASHRVTVVHHIHHHYHYYAGHYHHYGYGHHYYAGGVVVPPPGYPPPYGYSTFDQPLAGAGIIVGDPYWGNRGTLQLLFNSIGDRPYAQ